MATVLPVNNPVHAPTLVVCHLPAAQANTAAYAELLDTAEQRRCRRLPTATAQARYMVSRALLRLELAACLGCRPAEVAFTSGEHGKPRLRDGSWHFNLSHSGEWLALALSPDAELGVDVESHQRRNRLPAMARRYFAPLELQQMEALDERAWRMRFFHLWTLKEAYTKALGTSLWFTLSAMSVDLAQAQAGRAQVRAREDLAGRLLMWHFPLAPAYSLALAMLMPTAGVREMRPQVYRSVPGEYREKLVLPADISGIAV